MCVQVDAPPGDFLLRGARTLLTGLADGGVTCFLASGTDVEFVREETELLGLTHFFTSGVRFVFMVRWRSTGNSRRR